MARQRTERLLVLGLDGASSHLLFDRFRSNLPAVSALADEAITGELDSVVPATSLPAWPALFTGRDPGMLGIYGSRQRIDHTYAHGVPVTSRFVLPETLWDAVGKAGDRSIVIGVPPSYPPRSLQGVQVSCTLTPEGSSVFTYPPELSAAIQSSVGQYRFDLHHLDANAPEQALAQARELTTQHFTVLRTLMRTEDWRLAIVVDPSVDRLQHAFWHAPEVIRAHYAVVDAELGRTLGWAGPETVVAIVSEHGARASRGSFAINDWLIREGYLRVQQKPDQVVPLERAELDWAHTTAWAEGGASARLMLNVQGREPAGSIEPRQYERVRNELKRKLEQTAGPDGKQMGNRAYKPEELYGAVQRVAPDLLCTLGSMAWRATGMVGHEELFLPPVPGVSTGNHAERGAFLLRWPRHGPNGPRQGIRLLDLYPTFLDVLGLPIADDLLGHPVLA